MLVKCLYVISPHILKVSWCLCGVRGKSRKNTSPGSPEFLNNYFITKKSFQPASLRPHLLDLGERLGAQECICGLLHKHPLRFPEPISVKFTPQPTPFPPSQASVGNRPRCRTLQKEDLFPSTGRLPPLAQGMSSQGGLWVARPGGCQDSFPLTQCRDPVLISKLATLATPG